MARSSVGGSTCGLVRGSTTAEASAMSRGANALIHVAGSTKSQVGHPETVGGAMDSSHDRWIPFEPKWARKASRSDWERFPYAPLWNRHRG